MNLGFLDKSLAKQYPQLYGTNRVRSGLFPPSLSMQNRSVGLLQSPAIEDVSDLSTFLYNRAVVPSVNYLGENINPNIEQAARYFGFDVQNLIPNLQEKDFNFSTKKTTTDQPQTITQELTAGIDKAQADKDEKPDVSLQGDGLLSNQQIKDNNVKPNLFNTFESTPAKEGGFTYNLSVTDGQGITDKKQTTEQTTDDVKVDDKEQKVKVTGVDDAPVTDSSVEAVPTSDNKELTPTSSFMKKFENFANTEFGQDFFASLLAESGPKVGTPVSFGANFGKAYEKARELQTERNEKAQGTGDRSFAYMMQVTDGPQAGKAYPVVMDEKGNFEAVINNKKVPVTSDLFDGAYRISTTGNLGAGSITASDFTELTKLVNEEGINIRKLEDFILDVNQMDSGPLNKFINQMNFYVKNILDSNDMTDKELLQEIASGRFQELVGANRLNILGPGVLTEQDAERLIEALGGDPSNFFNNKQKSLAILSDILKNKYELYESNYRFYEDQTKIGNFATRDPVDKYILSDPVTKLMDRVNVGFIDYRTLKPEEIRTLSLEQLEGLDLGLLSDEHLEVVDEMFARYNDKN